VRNAVTHGAATRIALAGHRLDHTITITVDDNGRGLPAENTRTCSVDSPGSSAAAGGSGLGLALVVQQAALHGGNIVLSDSPLGGLRATLTLSTEPLQDSTDQS
jgi:two-component system sensor histidine kinase PrrB